MTAPAAASDAGHELRDGGGRQHPEEPGVDAGGGQPGRQRPLEHRAAAAGVAADQHPRPRGEAAAEGPPDREGELGRQVAVGHPADPVGPEQPP